MACRKAIKPAASSLLFYRRRDIKKTFDNDSDNNFLFYLNVIGLSVNQPCTMHTRIFCTFCFTLMFNFQYRVRRYYYENFTRGG